MILRFSILQVNRHLAHKQHLAAAFQSNDLAFVQNIGPLRAVPPLTAYLSLWARVRNPDREQLDHLLYRERSLVRMLCLNSQLCMAPKTLVPAYHTLTAHLYRDGGSVESLLDTYQVSTKEKSDCRQALCQRLFEILNTRGPSTIDELESFLPELRQRISFDPDLPELGEGKLGIQLLPAMCAKGLLVRTAPRGGWRSDHYRYATLASWLPDIQLDLALDEALRQVILHYITAFGPVTVGDIVHWVGGMARRNITTILSGLEPDLAHIQIIDTVGDYILPKDQVEALRQMGTASVGVALLPPRDSLLSAYSNPSRFVPEYDASRVFDRAGEAIGTIWSDGSIVGTWNLRQREGQIIARFFEHQPPEVWAQVAEKARQLSVFVDMASLDLDMGVDETDIDAYSVLPETEELLAGALPHLDSSQF